MLAYWQRVLYNVVVSCNKARLGEFLGWRILHKPSVDIREVLHAENINLRRAFCLWNLNFHIEISRKFCFSCHHWWRGTSPIKDFLFDWQLLWRHQLSNLQAFSTFSACKNCLLVELLSLGHARLIQWFIWSVEKKVSCFYVIWSHWIGQSIMQRINWPWPNIVKIKVPNYGTVGSL